MRKEQKFDQAEYVQRMRASSNLDKSFDLGWAELRRPEFGPSAAEYYAKKFLETGSYGEYWALNPEVEHARY